MSTASSATSAPPTSSSDQQQRPPASQAQRTAEAKAAFVASLTSVGSTLDADLQARATDIHKNAKQLDKQEADLQKSTKMLGKQGDGMAKLVERTKKDLGGYDDLDAIMAGLDGDLAIIEETLRIAERGDRVEEEEEGEGLGEEIRDEGIDQSKISVQNGTTQPAAPDGEGKTVH